MHTEKFKTAVTCRNICNEQSRTAKEYKNDVHTMLSQMNYNLCPHEAYTNLVSYIKSRTGKNVRKDANLMFDTVITLPKKYEGDQRKFFEESYEGLKEIYGLTDAEVIQSYVHLDEASPHMHFCAIPMTQDNRLCYKEIIPRSKYQSQHQELSEYLQNKGIDVKLARDTEEIKTSGRCTNLTLEELKGKTAETEKELIECKKELTECKQWMAEKKKLIRIVGKMLSNVAKLQTNYPMCFCALLKNASFKEFVEKIQEVNEECLTTYGKGAGSIVKEIYDNIEEETEYER